MSEQEPLKILQALGDELERATLADERAAGAPRRRFRLPGLPMLVLIAAVSITGVAAAATHLFGLAAPVSAPPRADVPASLRPLPLTVQMAGIDAADPDGLPSWDVRVSHSAGGEICTAVGQMQDGVFGILGLDRRFRALPLGAADACGAPPAAGAVQVGARAAVGTATMSPRTLVVGVAGADISEVRLGGASGRVLPLGRGHVFLAVLEGLPDSVQPSIAYVDRRSPRTTTVVRLASDEVDQAPDPESGRPVWQYRTGSERQFVYLQTPDGATKPPKPGRVCVSARQAENPTVAGTDADYFPAQTPITCWPERHAAVVVSARRLVPSAGSPGPFQYGLNPSRTVVQGIIGHGVRSVSIPGGPDHAAVAAIHAGTHSPGAFVWVFDGRVDPNGITLDVVLQDGRHETVRSSGTLVDAGGVDYTLPRAPAWQDLAAVKAQLGDGSFTRKTPGSDGLSRTVPNPAGGPAWAAHTWLAVSDRPATPNDHEQLVCAAFGPLVDGAVRQVVGTRVTAAEPTGRAIQCTPEHPVALKGRFAPPDFLSLFPTVYVDDPASPTPHVAYVAMTALFPGITSATLERHRDRVRTAATVGPRGSALVLLPPSYAAAGTELRWHLTYAGGRHITTDWASVSTGQPSGPPAVRAPDPGGAASWALNPVSRRNPAWAAIPGQLVAGRIASLDPSTGVVVWSNGGMGSPPLTRRRPVSLRIDSVLDSPSDQPGRAQIERRIAPGRTVIYGHALPGTRTLTIQTPRDVRTIRPSKVGGLFLAVYDGRFTQGRVTVTANGPGVHGSVTQPVDR